MEQANQGLYQMLEDLSQPAFCVRAEHVCFCNTAAHKRLIRVGDRVEELVGEHIQRYREYDGAEALHLTVKMGRNFHAASIHRVEDLLVFVVDPQSEGAPGSELLFNMGMTMRQPLASLHAVASQIFPILEDMEDAKLQQKTAAMNRSLYQLLRLVDNISDAEEAFSGELRLRPERVEVLDFFRELFERAASLCAAAGVHFTYQLPQKAFPGWLDKQRVKKIVLGLLSNALKFSPKGSTITAELCRSEDRIVLHLRDDGEGMDAETLAAAFTRFEREKKPGDPRCGVGLGLFLARRLAMLHGGTVMLESGPGNGTTAVVTLSVKQPNGMRTVFRSSSVPFDRSGGFDPDMVELSDVLPIKVFDTMSL